MGTDSEGTATEPTENFNPLAWWATATYPSMRQWAFSDARARVLQRIWGGTGILREGEELDDRVPAAAGMVRAEEPGRVA
jgi:hypothetical protein